MSDASFIHDFVFQYAAFRHHSFFFSHEFGIELFEPYQHGGGTWGVEGSGANEDTFPSPVISALDAELTYLQKDTAAVIASRLLYLMAISSSDLWFEVSPTGERVVKERKRALGHGATRWQLKEIDFEESLGGSTVHPELPEFPPVPEGEDTPSDTPMAAPPGAGEAAQLQNLIGNLAAAAQALAGAAGSTGRSQKSYDSAATLVKGPHVFSPKNIWK
ncbi:hypothetical protein AK812_SmicGene37440 [Symbiodinium microadriaticum]|uniref:Uncharacterized protein n=1 Tax=Symbiodinium microadriaticum TaxID=2951 RepID=A0A1Q9CGA2_SYMMI|nr:hypothetical protein AK812_SmicGene37440 [Symbiodinium microadriaticum]